MVNFCIILREKELWQQFIIDFKYAVVFLCPWIMQGKNKLISLDKSKEEVLVGCRKAHVVANEF